MLFYQLSYAGSYIELYPKAPQSKLYGPIDVVTCTDGDVVGTDCGDQYTMYGSIIEIASGTITLPTAYEGMWSCVKSTSAAVINIDVQATDAWNLDGVLLSDGDKITSPGADDDTVCFYADATPNWTTVHNPDGFIDGN